jgi:hypothetical protein
MDKWLPRLRATPSDFHHAEIAARCALPSLKAGDCHHSFRILVGVTPTFVQPGIIWRLKNVGF